MRIYIAGPMTPTRFDQDPDTSHTYQHFLDANDRLKEAGHLVYCPALNEIPESIVLGQESETVVYVQDPTYTPRTAEEWASFGADEYTQAYREVMSRDVRWILECDAIALLPGWRRSQGAMFEHSLGCILGLKISNVAEFCQDPDQADDDGARTQRPRVTDEHCGAFTTAERCAGESQWHQLLRTLRSDEQNLVVRDLALLCVTEELRRVDLRWGVQNLTPLQWLAILTEEVGEASKELADARIQSLDRDHYHEELTQCAAMALRALETSLKEARGELSPASFTQIREADRQ